MSSIRPSVDRLIFITMACLAKEIFQQSKTKNIEISTIVKVMDTGKDLLKSENQ